MSLPEQRLRQLDLHFRAANYLSAAQLYLADNALLRRPLKAEQVKKRLLGHWGTTPGLNFIHTHLNRLIVDTGSPMLQVVGVGHGAPGVLSCLYLEGSLGEVYPQYGHGAEGLQRFVRAFSWPEGFPSHLTAQVPGTIHEGGELGYSLLHAHGAAFDQPELIVPCVIGDGEAETGPLAASWHSPRFVDPRQDGAVLPILHLNGYKLSGPTLLARMPQEQLVAMLAAHGYQVRVVAGDEPMPMHRQMWEALDWAHEAIRKAQREARAGSREAVQWPLIVLRTPKGWTGPKELDGKPVEGTFHAHQIPIPHPRTEASHLAALDHWLHSYRPQELFGEDGAPKAEVIACCPKGTMRLGRTPYADGGARLKPLLLPNPRHHAVSVAQPGADSTENASVLGRYLREVFERNAEARNFRLFCPDETDSNKLGAVFEATTRRFEEATIATDEGLGRDGRVMEVLSEHLCEGWLEGYLQSGRHGIFACYEAFISIVDSMMFQYAKWQKMAHEVEWRKPVASLNFLLTSHVWEQDHNGYSHQGPTFINALLTKKSAQVRIYLPPDANCLLVAAAQCLDSRDRINLIVTSKKPVPQWLTPQQALDHVAAGASTWAGPWDGGASGEPEVVLACAGDVPTREAAAAALLLRRHVPELRLRLVNIVDLLCLQQAEHYARGLADRRFAELFTEQAPVVMSFHGYPMLIHELIYQRPAPTRFHVHGYREEGTTTTPFDMLVRNRTSRFDLALDALRRSGRDDAAARRARELFERQLQRHHAWVVENGDDLPEVERWDSAIQ